MLNSVSTKVCITSLDKLLDKVSPFLEDIAEKLDTSFIRPWTFGFQSIR